VHADYLDKVADVAGPVGREHQPAETGQVPVSRVVGEGVQAVLADPVIV